MRAYGFQWFISKELKNKYFRRKEKNLGSHLGFACYIYSKAISAKFEWKLAGFAVLFSRQIQTAPMICFSLPVWIFLKFFWYETLETYTLTFLSHMYYFSFSRCVGYDNFWGSVYKGQLNSEWIYEVIVSPKMTTINYQDFNLEVY